jgi:hypothetical protein
MIRYQRDALCSSFHQKTLPRIPGQVPAEYPEKQIPDVPKQMFAARGEPEPRRLP